METPQIKATVEVIGPERAHQLLATLSDQQRIRRGFHVKYLRGQIEADYWKVNGESIKISNTGKVIDGQHRLAAIIASGKPIETVVVSGIDEAAFITIDTGMRRRPSDILQMRGEVNSVTLAGAASNCIIIEYGMEERAQLSGFRRSPIAIMEYIDRNKRIRQSVSLASSHFSKLISPSAMAALHYLYTKKKAEEEVLSTFVIGMEQGFLPTKWHNFHILREKLITAIVNHHRSSRTATSALAIIAINATLIGQKLSKVEWLAGEPFPKIKAG